jgi:hypothetical protein
MSSAFEKALLESRIEHREGEASSHVALRIITLAKRKTKLCEGAGIWGRLSGVLITRPLLGELLHAVREDFPIFRQPDPR